MNVVSQELRLRFRRRLELEELLCVVHAPPGVQASPHDCSPVSPSAIVARLRRAYEIKEELGLMTREEMFQVPLLARNAKMRAPSERGAFWLEAHLPRAWIVAGPSCLQPLGWLDGINSVNPGFGTKPTYRRERCPYLRARLREYEQWLARNGV